MIQRTVAALPDLYEEDETAWLEAMADLVRQGRYADLDYLHLAEYLEDMALRDRREVRSRLTVLIAHLLKWTFQPKKRTRSWRRTVVVQRQELTGAIGRGVLRNHAEAVLPAAYRDAVERASVETGLLHTAFPAECPWTVDQLLSQALPED
jgi:hypothetical protein